MNTNSSVRLLTALALALILDACSPPPGEAAMCRTENVTGSTNSITISEGTDLMGRAGDLRQFTSDPTDGIGFIQDNRSDDQFFADPSYREFSVSILIPGGAPTSGQVLQLGRDFTITFAMSYPEGGPYDYPSAFGVNRPEGDMTLTIVDARTWILDGHACGEAATNFTHPGYLHAVQLVLHPSAP